MSEKLPELPLEATWTLGETHQVKAYRADQMTAYALQARADLQAYVTRVESNLAESVGRELALQAERDRLKEQVRELRKALEYVLGPRDDEKIGWRRHTNDPIYLTCEFCGKRHEDVTLIEHLSDCPVTVARNALAATERENGTGGTQG